MKNVIIFNEKETDFRGRVVTIGAGAFLFIIGVMMIVSSLLGTTNYPFLLGLGLACVLSGIPLCIIGCVAIHVSRKKPRKNHPDEKIYVYKL